MSNRNNSNLRKTIRIHGIAIIIFFLISAAYMYPVFSGRQLYQGDMANFKGMSKEIVDHREKYHEEPLWTNSMFGGMPAYQISVKYRHNILKPLHNLFMLFGFVPVSYLFLCLAGAYIALIIFGVNPWLSITGAIAYSFSSYIFTLLEAGHVAKIQALGYLPPVIAGIYLAFRGKMLLGSLVTGIFLGLQLFVNHFQITYYTFVIVLVYGIYEFYYAAKENRLNNFYKPLPLLILVALIAAGVNAGNFLTTLEYSKYSTRGGSELRQDKGLDKGYITDWSYGIDETLTFLIPNFKGGSSYGSFGENSESFKLIKESQGKTKAKKAIASLPSYWGKQPFTSGPFYAGACVVFLFILGLFVVKGRIKWWLFTITVLAIIISWGRNFQWFTNLLIDYLPGFKKFRDVKMILIVADFAFPMLGIMAFNELIQGNFEQKTIIKYLKYVFFGLAGFLLVIILIAGSFNFESAVDEQYRQQGAEWLVNAFHADRLSILRADALRSLILITLTATIVYFVVVRKIKTTTAVALLGSIILIDLWTVNKRYLNSDNFVAKKQYDKPFAASTADIIILQDKDPDYRVLNLAVNTFNDASTSYFHKSVGGYHGAKMSRYQDLIEKQIYNNIQNIINTFNARPTPEALDSILAFQNVLNMLNTRYIIYNREAPPLVNDSKLGNDGFVKKYRIVNGAKEEMDALSDFIPHDEAIVDKSFEKNLEGLIITDDSSSYIELTEYRANYLKYNANCKSEKLTVFSEIFYDKGWQAYIDGNPVPHFRANYVLRAMRIPAGEHIVEFKFHPRSYFAGEKISLASSVLFLLLFAGTIWYEWKKKAKDEN